MNNARPQISLRKRIIFSLLVTVAFIGVVELCFRGLELVNPPRHIDYGLGFNAESRVFVQSPQRPGSMETHPAKRVSFVRQRFAREKPDNVFRIVALGGSSVNYLEPEFGSIESKLSQEFTANLEVEIINCGGHAYGSHRLVIVFREMLDFDPDLIVLYSGHNEFEEVEQLHLSDLNRLGFDRAVFRKSALVRFIRDRRTDYDISRIEKEHNQRLLSRNEPVSETNFARAWAYDFTMQDVDQRMQQYEHNLRLVLTLSEEQRIPVVMGTMASNLLRPYIPQHAAARYTDVYELWKQDKTAEGLSLARKILVETPGRHQSSDLENDILRNLAQEFSVPLVDVEAMVTDNEPHKIPGETLFEDHCHLNAAGRAVWISGYAPRIREIIAEKNGQTTPGSTTTQ